MTTDLNPAQRAAVEHEQGPLLVLAGAGSGKTRVITRRIARLLERGHRPETILAVSFTNKAAGEMTERLRPLIGKDAAKRAWLSTFHSFGVRFLKEEAHAIAPGAQRFAIFDQGDALGLVREILRREMRGDRKLDAAALLARISLWKNAFLAPEEVRETDVEYDALARKIYPLYEARLRAMHAVDFDDLVVVPVRALREHPELREKWRARFRHMLVDEFQDTNRSQLELVRLLANELRNVCVVGDDDQSIYGWRGADVGNILDFESHFPGAVVVKLEDNYRSRAPILGVANAAIANSTMKRHSKTLRAARGGGEPVRLVVTDDATAEARSIAKEMRDLVRGGRRYGQMAVLYRSNLQARLVEEELRLQGIPYQLFGGTQFFDRKEVKDVTAYLRLLVHPRDELSLRRIVNTPPRGIGDVSLERLASHARAKGRSLAEALAEVEFVDLPEAAKRGALRLHGSLARARAAVERGDGLVEVGRRLLEDVELDADIGADDGSESGRTQAKRRRENVEHVLRGLERYEAAHGRGATTLAQYVDRVTLRFGNEEEEETGDRVTLSTLHAAKGLEFDVVFLIGCVEGQLPHSRTTDPKVSEAAPTDVEEERRLFYVGVTRAREILYLTRPRRRSIRGRVTPLTPSRFLSGLPEEMTTVHEARIEEELDSDELAAMSQELLERLMRG